MKFVILLTVCLMITVSSKAQDPKPISIVPIPVAMEVQNGAFVLDSMTVVTLSDDDDEELRAIAGFFRDLVATSSGLPLPLSDKASSNAITFELNAALRMPAEGYQISVSSDGVDVVAPSHEGLFRGVQTLRQLLPHAVERAGLLKVDHAWSIPAIEISDYPRFEYRGMHLDVSRHFFSVDFVKRYIDMLAFYKMNRFHWHLTEDQGWRIEIKQYPRLTEVGAFRKETLIGHYRNQPHQFDGERYGGFYTQDEIREIVQYATDRYITVIPEIEMPGHSVAALAAYPELGCAPGPFEVGTIWGVYDDIYCPKEETFEFLQNVLTEVMELFPSTYIHIGGDEAPKTRWKESPIAQEVIKREGLADEHELQSYFIQRIEKFLNANGRSLIGWDEILEGGLAPNATVMSWRGEAGGIAAAKQGHDVIMTPGHSLYFDHYQGDPANEPNAIGGLTMLEDVYNYDPLPDELTDEEKKHILGAQANVWTEYMKTPQKVEYMVFPRMLALSEVVWSPYASRDWESFQERLPAQLKRLDVMTVNYRKE